MKLGKKFYANIGRKGGLSCLNRYGVEHFRKISGKEKCGKAVLEKYGKEHFRKLGKKSGELRLKQKGRAFFKDISKKGISKLAERYGNAVHSKLGKLGAKALFEKHKKEEIIRNLTKRSLDSTAKYQYKNHKFRSKMELEVAKLLDELKIPFKYEENFKDYFPDFTLVNNNTIIEVCGVLRKGYVEHVVGKIRSYIDSGFQVIVLTTPKLSKEFKKLLPNVSIATTINSLRACCMAGKACR